MNKENLNIVFQNDTFKFVLRGLILILGVVIVCLLLCPKTEEKEVKTIVLHDTTVVHDTVIKTIPKTQIEYKEIKITDTIFIDTSKIAFIESKHYSDSLSDIWVSGYKPEIDSINYHIPQQTIYIDKIVEIEKPKKPTFKDKIGFTIGVYGGYSPIYNNFDVIVGAGFSIRLN